MPVTPQKTPVEARVQEHIAFARGTTAPGMFHETAQKHWQLSESPMIRLSQTHKHGLTAMAYSQMAKKMTTCSLLYWYLPKRHRLLHEKEASQASFFIEHNTALLVIMY